MPIAIAWGLSALGIGAGVKLFGSGVEDSAQGFRDVAVVALVGGGLYLYGKKQGLI